VAKTVHTRTVPAPIPRNIQDRARGSNDFGDCGDSVLETHITAPGNEFVAESGANLPDNMRG